MPENYHRAFYLNILAFIQFNFAPAKVARLLLSEERLWDYKFMLNTAVS
jgi:hypothetical protein